RFKIEGVKNPVTANSMQLSEFALYNGGVNVTPDRIGIAYDSTGGTGNNAEASAFPAGEPPEKAVDGILANSSKWLDFRAKDSRSEEDKARVWLRIDFASAQPVTSYNWATGGDSPERDPAAWRLQGSYDGATWVDLDVKTGYVATGTRSVWVETDGFPVSSANANMANILGDAAPVMVKAGASLVLDGVSETVGGLSGDGTVALSGADLTLAPPAGAEAFFTGAVTGSGGLVKTGPGSQYLFGTSSYTGPTVVSAGNLVIQRVELCRWFRFTIKKNRGNVAVTQFSELALYSADGQRWNIGLASAGTGVATLGPAQFATPATYSLGSGAESADKLFDNNTGTKWCPNNNTPSPADPATHRVVVMRLADDTPEITAYNLCTANDDATRDPVTWTLEGSLDGAAWTLLDARDDIVPPAGRRLYYTDVPFALSARAVSYGAPGGVSDAIPSDSVVEVRGGATLTVNAQEQLGALRVDMLDAGTITTLIPAPNGTIYITTADGQKSNLVLPLTIGTIEDRANLASWTVVIDGVVQSGATLSVGADGYLRLGSKGTLLLLR
ncbi:MAG: hypothetical protein LBW77_06455, partial [Verrucomicrobiota bacterium]|nr:hypothetical protein [Verrucomicrobiota bacterium]